MAGPPADLPLYGALRDIEERALAQPHRPSAQRSCGNWTGSTPRSGRSRFHSGTRKATTIYGCTSIHPPHASAREGDTAAGGPGDSTQSCNIPPAAHQSELGQPRPFLLCRRHEAPVRYDGRIVAQFAAVLQDVRTRSSGMSASMSGRPRSQGLGRRRCGPGRRGCRSTLVLQSMGV